MLILTRKPGESLYIGDDIKITIVELKGHQIRVGIQAPKDLRIYREEIYLQIMEENKKAAEAPLSAELGLEGLPTSFGEVRSGVLSSSSMGGEDGSDGKGTEGGTAGIPSEPKRAGLSAFSVHRAGKSTAEKTSSREPEVQVRRKKAKKADE